MVILSRCKVVSCPLVVGYISLHQTISNNISKPSLSCSSPWCKVVSCSLVVLSLVRGCKLSPGGSLQVGGRKLFLGGSAFSRLHQFTSDNIRPYQQAVPWWFCPWWLTSDNISKPSLTVILSRCEVASRPLVGSLPGGRLHQITSDHIKQHQQAVP